MDKFLAELQSDVSEGIPAEEPTVSPRNSEKRKSHGQKTFLEKSSRFVEIDANKLRYLLREQVEREEKRDSGKYGYPLLDWGIRFQSFWVKISMFTSGLLAGCGIYTLIEILSDLRHGREITLSKDGAFTPVFILLYFLSFIGSLDRLDIGSMNIRNMQKKERILSLLVMLCYSTGLGMALTTMNVPLEVIQGITTWRVVLCGEAALPIAAWLLIAQNPEYNAFTSRLTQLRDELTGSSK